MTTDEIHEMIQACDPFENLSTTRLLAVLEHLNNKIANLEARQDAMETLQPKDPTPQWMKEI